MERHSFRIILGESLKAMRKLCPLQNVHTRELGEITSCYEMEHYHEMGLDETI